MRKRRADHELWFELRIGARRWRVYLSKPGSFWLKEKGEDLNLLGLCVPGRAEIHVKRDLGAAWRERAWVHELLHAAVYETGARNKGVWALKKGWDAAEEFFARVVEGEFLKALKRAGMVRQRRSSRARTRVA